VKKVVGSVATVFVYDAGGRLVAEYGGAQSQTSGASYVTQDTLGSTRAVTGQSQEVRGRYDYLPFGEEVYAGREGYGGGDINQRFTGKERDEETEMDYFGARYYTNTQGRVTSADSLLSSGDVKEPQRWNCYAYVLNNPSVSMTPLGQRMYFRVR
jgi:RHS repeat-associated protein